MRFCCHVAAVFAQTIRHDWKMSSNREWMYTMRASTSGVFNPKFQEHVKYFLDFAYANAKNIRCKTVEGENVFQIRCPCSHCENRCYKDRESVLFDLYYHGFMKRFKSWKKDKSSMKRNLKPEWLKNAHNFKPKWPRSEHYFKRNL